MKNQDHAFDKSLEAIRAFREALQGWLFPSLEAEIGNLDKAHRDFVAICAAVHGDFPAAKFAWCGNGKPPVSRWSYFKAYMAKAKWNFRTTGALIGELAARPVLRRLCGFEDAGDIPSESSFSRVFRLFDADETVQKVFAKFIGRAFDGALIHHASIDAMAVHARERPAAPGPDAPKTASRLEIQPP